MSNNSRLERLERAMGQGKQGGGPPVDLYIADNGRDPDISSRPDVVCYDPNEIPEEPSERDAFFKRLRGDRHGVVTFLSVKS